MNTVVLTIAIKVLNVMPFSPTEKKILTECMFQESQPSLAVLNNCIQSKFPQKWDELHVWEGQDGKYCARYPYKADIKYYGDHVSKPYDPCSNRAKYGK